MLKITPSFQKSLWSCLSTSFWSIFQNSRLWLANSKSSFLWQIKMESIMCPLQLSLRVATVHIKVRIGSLEYFVICQKCTKEQGKKLVMTTSAQSSSICLWLDLNMAFCFSNFLASPTSFNLFNKRGAFNVQWSPNLSSRALKIIGNWCHCEPTNNREMHKAIQQEKKTQT